MLNEIEVSDYIESHLPEMQHRINTQNNGNRILENIIGLSGFMEEKYREHNFREIKKICNVAEHLYNEGSCTVKSSIEKLFVGCLSAIMPEKKEERCRLQAIIPISIYSVYVQQFLYKNHKKQ